MIATADADIWSPSVFVMAGCVLLILVYARGCLLLRRTRPSFSWWRLVSFGAGVSVLWIALGSPLEELADTLLSAHMLEHLLLMSAVPPLLLVSWPMVPLLRGLPVWIRHLLLSPILRSTALRAMLHQIERPVVAWLLMNLVLLAWHIPAAYDFALQHEGWHIFEHVCFLSTSMLFWWVLLRPWPAKQKSMGWGAPLYLIFADVVNTALSATLAFIGHPVYPYYLQHQNSWQLDPMSDQTIGASLMWVLGSAAFLLPALVYADRLLQPGTHEASRPVKSAGR